MNTSTNETCPRHIWLCEVLSVAGVGVRESEFYRERLNRAYNAGEPVWMAADELKFVVRQRAIDARAESEHRAMVAAFKNDGRFAVETHEGDRWVRHAGVYSLARAREVEERINSGPMGCGGVARVVDATTGVWVPR